MYDTIIHNGLIVTADNNFNVIENGWLAITDGIILRVEKMSGEEKLPDAHRMVDAGGNIVMPGLVNTHTHLPMSLFRGLADDLPLDRWLNDYIFPAEATHLNPETVRLGTLLSCAEMLLSGTTTCCDGYFFETHVAGAVVEAGLRAVLGQGIIDFPAPGVPDPGKNVDTAMDFVSQWKNRHPNVIPAIFCHSPYTCGPETLKAAGRAAEEAGVCFQIHIAETRGESAMIISPQADSPIRHLEKLGLLTKNTLLVHSVWTDKRDIDIIAKSGAGVSHNPESNMKLASGVAPVVQMLSEGVNVGLGTDGCASNNNLDMFQEMDTAAKLHKVFQSDPTAVQARAVLKTATTMGADAIGLGENVGSLEPGKMADVLILDIHQPHLTPMYHPESHLVYAARGADVRDVWVGGEQVVKNRKLLTIDVQELMRQVNKFAKHVGKHP